MEANQINNLVDRVKNGDQEAFSVLYDEFADRIYRYIRLKVSAAQEAEDIMQDVFVKAWQGAKALETTDLNFSAWLYRVASNTINDHYRKVYRRPQTIGLEPAHDLPTEDLAARQTDLSFQADVLQEKLSQIPEHYKQIIELRYLQNFTIQETAKILNKSSISVRVLQHRAVKKLQELYQDHGQQNN